LCLLASSGRAHAQSGQNEAAAQALYDEARKLMEAKDFAAACPKFKESYDLAAGGGTLLNLADCYEKSGKTALAWSTFKEALVIAQRELFAARVEFAKAHLAALEPNLSYVTVKVAAEPKLEGLNVTVDGTPLGSAAWGVAVPMDPGKHVVRAEAPGHKPFEQTVDIQDKSASRETVNVPALEADRSGSTGTDTGATGGDAKAAVASGGGSGRTIGWVAMGVGAVGVGLGSFFGLKAFSDWDDRNTQCKGGCTEGAKEAGESASSAATLSTVAFAVGVGAIGVGTVLILTSGSSDKQTGQRAPLLEASVLATPGGVGVSMRHPW
jgi:hypothetical protein